MSQTGPSNSAHTGDDDGALVRLELKVELLTIAVHELLEEEPFPPSRPVGRFKRLRHPVKLYVISGGLAALLAGAYALPPQNPVHQAVSYTVSTLVQQLPDFQPGVSLLNPLQSHPAADVAQPSSLPLVISHVGPSPTPADQPAAPVDRTVDNRAPDDSTSAITPSTSGPTLLPMVTAPPATEPTVAPTPIPTPTPSTTPPATPSPSPTSLPFGPAPSPTGGAGPPNQQQQGKAKKPKPSPSPSP